MIKDYEHVFKTFWDEETREESVYYFEKYWLDRAEYLEKWLPIQDEIFNSKAKYLPDIMFNDEFDLFPLVGGDIFVSERDFASLTDCLRQTGETHFVIVQNSHVPIGYYDSENNFIEHPQTRFKYPSSISWPEIMSGGDAASEHFHNGCKDYFVFGDSGNWGRYVGNSYTKPTNLESSNPLNIMGFKEEFSELFRTKFDEVRRLEPEITPEILLSEWLPDSYKQLTGGALVSNNASNF